MSGPYNQQGYPPYGGSPAQPYQPYNAPPPAGSYNRPPPQQPTYPAPQQAQQGYARPPPPPPQGQPYGSSGSPYPGQQPVYPGQQAPYPGPPQSPYPPGPHSPYPGQQPPYHTGPQSPHPGAPSPYPGQQPPYSQGPPSYPPQGAPAGYPGGQGRPGPSQGPPGGQYGAPPPQAAPVTPQQVSAYRQLLISTIQEKNLQPFYPPERLDRLVQTLANDAPARLAKLTHEWSVPMEVATDVMKLSLFDVILYVDDSGSIEFEEKGLRKDQLRQILGLVATAASTFDQDGISVRFMNSMETGDGIRNADDVNNLVSRVRFAGLTPLGTSLRSKVIDPMIVGPARANRLDKPVLVITITDGQPAGEPHGAVGDAIRHAIDETSRTRYGRGAVSFQFSQVGTDQRAREFLGDLDEDPQIGHLIDCTSNFEVEQDEMSRANPPVHLTRELWCAKLMLGAIDASYDTKDEKASSRAGGPPPPQGSFGGYNQPPPGPGPGGYSAPPPGYPPQGQSPQPGYPQQPPSQSPYPPSTGGPEPGYGQPQPYGYGGSSPHPSAGYPPAGGYPPPPRRY
ncbi:hypothetical protein N7532_008878 [Penicillium argentinense]|uniref:VWFA domain-containing protein n=1 Tax=Penicillium argentinense TaxID=1131581 RepID=A0A9W9K206_9EURO|nr:uncharacterized protein N7532_008878 [Penicillium argentinense]KAJ5090194.1 hypothetical protein N7532_008878 [Penicillium argentinense]